MVPGDRLQLAVALSVSARTVVATPAACPAGPIWEVCGFFSILERHVCK